MLTISHGHYPNKGTTKLSLNWDINRSWTLLTTHILNLNLVNINIVVYYWNEIWLWTLKSKKTHIMEISKLELVGST
jgi:hypothetical protein